MATHLHQCPNCGHIWFCDKADCQGDIVGYDARCVPWRSDNQREMSTVRALRLDRDSAYRRPRWKRGYRL